MKDSFCRLDAGATVLPPPQSVNDVTAEDAAPTGALNEDFVGDYVWSEHDSGALLDFEALALRADGSYVAKVVATLVNPHVRSFGGHPCMLPEEGTWNTYLVSGKVRLRVRPTTSRARVYSAAIDTGNLEISRRGQKTALLPVFPQSARVPIVAEHEQSLQRRSA